MIAAQIYHVPQIHRMCDNSAKILENCSRTWWGAASGKVAIMGATGHAA